MMSWGPVGGKGEDSSSRASRADRTLLVHLPMPLVQRPIHKYPLATPVTRRPHTHTPRPVSDSPAPPAHRREVSGRLRLSGTLAANVAAMRSAPMRTRYALHPPARASTSRAGLSFTIKSRHVLCDQLRYHTPSPRAGNRTNFYAFVHYVHTSRAPGYASPRRRIKLCSASCARPARAPPFWRYA